MKVSYIIYGVLALFLFTIGLILYQELTKSEPVRTVVPVMVDPDMALNAMRESSIKPSNLPQYKSEGTLFIHKKNETDTLDIEIADTDGQRGLGLMWRDSLPKNTGMLFIFNAEEPLSFWMKNCFFPQDMLFLNRNKIVQEIVYNALPMGGKSLLDDAQPHYPAQEVNGQYVVELSQGMAKKLNVQKGDSISYSQK